MWLGIVFDRKIMVCMVLVNLCYLCRIGLYYFFSSGEELWSDLFIGEKVEGMLSLLGWFFNKNYRYLNLWLRYVGYSLLNKEFIFVF